MEDLPYIFVLIIVLSLLFEFVDASIGMGYGTTLTPVLLLIGFSPIAVVPAVLIGQLGGGIVGSLAHCKVGNIQVNLRNWTRDTKIILILSACGVIGAIIGATVAISIDKNTLTLIIGLIVFLMGVYLLIKRHGIKFRWWGLGLLGVVSAFNKGLSGGGYGPLVTGGQLISGNHIKSSVGSTTMAEAFVCFVALVTFFVTKTEINWTLAASTAVGSICAAPLAALVVKKIKANWLKYVTSVAIIGLGLLTLSKVF